MELKKLPKIALGAWAWGNDGTFGGSLSADDLRPVFEAGMKAGLNLWDTAYAYGMGASERVLGDFIKGYPREDVILSDKFTPQCADPSAENAVTELSLLNRSSETSGILDYCKEKDITFFSYMVLEQGALSGKYDTGHPFPADSDRGAVYNPMLPQLEKLNACLKEIADAHGAAAAQVPVAWAIAKGTLPIIGVTKVYQVEDAAKAVALRLSDEEITRMEQLADEMQLDVIRYWEKEMK